MPTKKRPLNDPVDIKLPLDELEVMARFAGTTEFQILKRWARRYGENMKDKAFRLNPADPNMPVTHTRYREQAVGMQILIQYIENAGKRAEEEMFARNDDKKSTQGLPA